MERPAAQPAAAAQRSGERATSLRGGAAARVDSNLTRCPHRSGRGRVVAPGRPPVTKGRSFSEQVQRGAAAEKRVTKKTLRVSVLRPSVARHCWAHWRVATGVLLRLRAARAGPDGRLVSRQTSPSRLGRPVAVGARAARGDTDGISITEPSRVRCCPRGQPPRRDKRNKNWDHEIVTAQCGAHTRVRLDRAWDARGPSPVPSPGRHGHGPRGGRDPRSKRFNFYREKRLHCVPLSPLSRTLCSCWTPH